MPTSNTPTACGYSIEVHAVFDGAALADLVPDEEASEVPVDVRNPDFGQLVHLER